MGSFALTVAVKCTDEARHGNRSYEGPAWNGPVQPNLGPLTPKQSQEVKATLADIFSPLDGLLPLVSCGGGFTHLE